jgi:hypothetical protein
VLETLTDVSHASCDLCGEHLSNAIMLRDGNIDEETGEVTPPKLAPVHEICFLKNVRSWSEATA